MNQKVEDLEMRIRVLENENRLLKERLSEAGISYEDIADDGMDGQSGVYDPDQGARIKELKITDTVVNHFFMMFCRGRKDEYSCAMKSHFRKSGNQMSGKWKSSYASLLA